MKRLFILTCVFFLMTRAFAQSTPSPERNSEITFGKNAPNIIKITNDTIVIATGSTYQFTVDTPEDAGLKSTKTDVKHLLLQITSVNGSAQKYSVTDKNGVEKMEGDVVTGDRLVVSCDAGLPNKVYYIIVKPAALAGSLSLKQTHFTVNSKHALTLYFTAGQRSPDASIKIYLPAGINATMDNTEVNVIGRGKVKLSGLASQSIGRTGTKYSYHQVGSVQIIKVPGQGSILSFSHLDLRPANGADLEITINDILFKKAGAYRFKAVYTTSQPQTLISSGTGNETATLAVTHTISDFERIPLKVFRYVETPATYTTVNFKWGIGSRATGLEIMQSLDKGKTWSTAAAKINLKKQRHRLAG